MPKFSGGFAPEPPPGRCPWTRAPLRRAPHAAAVASMAAGLAALANPICTSKELACSSGTLAGMCPIRFVVDGAHMLIPMNMLTYGDIQDAYENV